MAITKAKRSVHPTQLTEATRRDNRGITVRHPERGKPAEGRNHIRGSSKDSARHNDRRASTGHADRAGNSAERTKSLLPNELALQEQQLGNRRFLWFPVVKGKIIEKIEFFTTREYHCLRIDFQDQTFLELEITPAFMINAALQQRTKADPVLLLEWPPIKSET